MEKKDKNVRKEKGFRPNRCLNSKERAFLERLRQLMGKNVWIWSDRNPDPVQARILAVEANGLYAFLEASSGPNARGQRLLMFERHVREIWQIAVEPT